MENGEDSTSTDSNIQFRRRLNRDSDKRFDKLSNDGKVSISSLRTALEDAKKKIDRLKDESEIKDDIIEDERSHRKALEERMENYLVDLYNNPMVNEELHQRLPRAKKKGHRLHGPGHGLDSEHDAGSESSDLITTNGNHIGPLELTEEMGMQPTAHQQQQHQHFNQTTDMKEHTDEMMTSPSAGLSHVSNTNTNTFQSAAMAGPYLSGIVPPGHPYYAPMDSHFLPNALASTSRTSFGSSSYVDLPSGHKQNDTQEVSQLNPQSTYSYRTEENRTSQKDTLPTQQAVPSVIDEHGTFLHTPFISPEKNQRAVPMLNVLPPLMTPVTGTEILSSANRLDNVSHISRLLQEITILKRENKELKRDLKEQRQDLALIKAGTSQGVEDKNTVAIAALIEEVKRAEKAGEQAVSQLLQSANEDRNVALHELNRLQLKTAKRDLPLDSNVSCGEATDENEVTDSLLSSDFDLEDAESKTDGPPLTSQHMKKVLERQREITKHQMEDVIAQRDTALDKVSRLQKKLSSIRLSEFPCATNQTLQSLWLGIIGLNFRPN